MFNSWTPIIECIHGHCFNAWRILRAQTQTWFWKHQPGWEAEMAVYACTVPYPLHSWRFIFVLGPYNLGVWYIWKKVFISSFVISFTSDDASHYRYYRPVYCHVARQRANWKVVRSAPTTCIRPKVTSGLVQFYFSDVFIE